MNRIRPTAVDWMAYLGMFTYAASVVVTPILLLVLSRNLSFSLGFGGGLEAVRTGFLLLVLLGSAALATRFGLERVLAAGALVLALGMLIYAVAGRASYVMAAMVLVGAGGGALEALMNPLIQERHPEEPGRYLNVANAFFSLGVVVAVLGAGEWLSRGLPWPGVVVGVAVVALGCALGFQLLARSAARRDPSPAEAPVEDPPAEQHTGAPGGARQLLKDKRFWIFAVAMFCGGGAEGAFTFWTASYVQLSWGAAARMGALATATFAAGMVVGRLASGHFVAQERLNRLILGSAVVALVASVAAWWVSSLFGLFAVVFVAGLGIACFWPSIQSHAASVLHADTTILFILLSIAGIPGYGLSSWIMGIIADRTDIRTSLLVIPVLMLILCCAMVLSARHVDNSRRSPS